MHCTPKKLTSKILSYALAAGMILSSPGVVHADDDPCAHAGKNEHAAVAATCTEPGNNLYYYCDNCHQYLRADGTTVTTLEAETIPALGHHWSDWTSDGDDTHSRSCDRPGCSETETQPHDFVLHADGDVCVCGATRTHEHSYASEWSYDSTGHWHACLATDCTDKADEATHTLDPVTGTCECGYHECVLSEGWSFDENEHWRTCAGCDQRSSVESHTWGEDGVCHVCNATRSSSSSGSSSSGGSSGSSESTAAELEAAKQAEVETIARIESAQPGDTVVVQSEALSENTMDALIANPEVTAQVTFEYGGEQVAVSFQNPIITEKVPVYGPEYLIGIHNRDQMLRVYTSLGFDPVMIRTLLAEDAKNAATGKTPILAAPAGGSYIFLSRGTDGHLTVNRF